MRTDLTDITLVVDRSGSMKSMQKDAEGGVNTFVHRQVAEPGEAFVTLVQFDNEYEFVHKGIRAKDFPDYAMVPRGSTALLDAVGRAITETGVRLGAMHEKDRPGLVIFVVVTDGEENSSREFTRDAIREMIELQQSRYNWQFTFLGANQDSFAEAGQIGFSATGTANFSPMKVAAALNATSDKVARMRSQRVKNETIDNSWTDSERKSMQ